MTDIYGIMNMASSALMAHQKAINVTGNNIANVNTPGYSRQKLLLETQTPMQSSAGMMGNGVEAVSVDRVYDRFLGVQINSESETLGRWEARKDGLELAEVIFDESGEFGLSQSINQFWGAWQNVSNDPSGYNERVVLQAKGDVMAGTFNRIYSDLQNAQQGFDGAIAGAVADINQLSQQVAELNQKIMEVEASGSTANDYRDQRDLALKELAGLIDTNSFEDSAGRVTVLVGSGQTLVESNSSRNLTTQVNGFGFKDIAWVGPDGTTANITSDISNGKVKGWLEARDVDMRGYLRQLDTLAETLTERVNTLHQLGWGLDGSNGTDFFTGTITASSLQVNTAITNDLDLIAASSTRTGIPGNNGQAIAIANLQHSLTMNSSSTTFEDYYNSLVSQVGGDVQSANAYFNHQSDMVVQLENRRESISGVSLDEEMINLIKFQTAYDAAAKLISTADELLQTVLNMV
jgi:flagellar hook-associated protein 1 FlgK